MEVTSLQLKPILHNTLTPTNLLNRGSFCVQFPKFCNSKRYPGARNVHFFQIRAQLPPGAASFSSAAVEAKSESDNSKDEDTVFVAGATGKVGSRTVRELLKLGFRVKAGVRSTQRAQSLVESVRKMKFDPEATGVQSIEKLELVECDLEKPEQIMPALGRASLVICTIGASEKEIFDVTGPYRIDYLATKNLIEAATAAKVDHFMLVTSLGTNKFGFPAAVLNLFWGVLCWKRKAEEALIHSGLPYTIVRPGGMERPTDSFKETHNLILYPEDVLFGGLVSNLQVAELLAFMAQNRELSYCKIVEAIAETTVPLTPMEELLAKIPSKRTYIPKAKAPEATVKEAPKVVVTEEAKDEETSTEKPLEVDAATPLLEREPKSPISEVPITPTEEEIVEDKSVVVRVPRPLSPYAAYEDLKPPTSPTPAPPIPQTKKTETIEAIPELLATSSDVSETEVASSEPPPEVPVKEKKQPLSPYAAYEDLKPPTSSSPSTPTFAQEKPSEASITVDGVPMVVDGTLTQKQALSPYAAYEDLKPPTSPSPASPTEPKTESSKVSETVDGVVNAVDGALIDTVPEKPIFYHSPYAAYPDLKPPTSPTPTAPISVSTPTQTPTPTPTAASDESQMDIPPNENTAEPVKVDEAQVVEDLIEPKSWPLSPYTMYADMKPPTSPTPRSH